MAGKSCGLIQYVSWHYPAAAGLTVGKDATQNSHLTTSLVPLNLSLYLTGSGLNELCKTHY